MHLRLLSLILSLMYASFMGAQTTPAFSVSMLSDSLVARMRCASLPQGAAVMPDQLRHLRLRYVDFQGQEQSGEMVCHKSVAEDLLYIFRRLYEARYPVASIRLIDDFDADDERSMQANNTSCLCYRPVAGTQKLSKHAMGMAVDLNPLQNPCVRNRHGRRVVQPATATAYADRTRAFPHKIDRNDLAYRLFVERGFRWGGAWRTVKDYQHFEK